MLLGEERLSYIALVKVNKNSDRRFSITNLSCVQVEPPKTPFGSLCLLA